MKVFDHILELIKTQAAQTVNNDLLYQELFLILLSYLAAYFIAKYARGRIKIFQKPAEGTLGPILRSAYQSGKLLFPMTAIILIQIFSSLAFNKEENAKLIELALIIASLYLLYMFTDLLVKSKFAKKLFYIFIMPVLFFHLVGILDNIVETLDGIHIQIGNIRVSAYGIIRVLLFGSLLFWLGRLSNLTGKKIIRSQANLDLRTKEVFSKFFEILVFIVVFLLLLQVMGINLTALTVFGGAIGVGLGFGLQSIASNFISGVIILLDRSVSMGDYIELEDGKTGRVTEMSLRSTTLESYDGKDIVVPNEKFITSSFINWTHKDSKQRYRVDFSVAYNSDIRKLIDIIKSAVASHPQVISGDDIPIEERPDCEIDSFGDSGINMFVEFWMEGIDDGKNRVGGDLLLIILEAIREHGFEIPFPQREVRILKNV